MAKYKSRFTGEEIDNKFGDALFDPTTYNQILFACTEDKMAYLSGDTSVPHKVCPFEFTRTVRRMTVVNLMDSKNLYYTQMSEKAIITVGFKSEEKGITDAAWSEATEDARITVEIDRGLTGKYETIVSEQLVLNGNTLSVDVFRYLATGNNRVRVTAVGVDTGSSGYIVYSALLTSMYIAPANFKWNVPFIEGGEYQLGGLYIGGALDKILKIKVSNEQTYLKTYEINIGSQTHTSIAYYYGGLEFPTEGTGIYTVEMWLDANVLESEHLSYNIMCIAEDDIDTAQLVCVGDVADEVDNYAENALFTYAAYNGNSQTATPTITLKMGSKQIATGTYEVSVGQYATYKYSFAIDTAETSAIITATVTNGNTITEDFPLNNESTFAPISGYTFYLSAAARYNSESNKTKIINAADGSIIDATWKDMAWVDGMDGWTVDDKGNKCLLIPAMSSVTADYALMSSANTCTIEMLYKVMNVSDFDEDIIKIASDTAQSWMGVKIKPTNILLHSQSLFSNDLAQSYNTRDEELVHLAIVIAPNYQQTGNIAMIYVNGVKKCSFEWSTGDTFAHSGKLVIGSQTADLYLYMMRVYNQAFSWTQVRQNYLSSIPDAATKAQIFRKEMSVLNDRNELDYNRIKGVYNTFVVELPEGASLPNKITNPNNIAVEGTNLYIDIVQEPTCSIQGEWLDVPLEGQGTTAMTYYRWNLRSKTSSVYDKFRITAKKNVASSMHSHKMGATRLYNELNLALVGANEANGRVAVYQYPVYGFLKIPNEAAAGTYIYEPIGLYTIGPDKGDKSTFGYDNALYKNTLIHMEGTDHSPRGVGMDYPWSELTVGENKDGDMFIGAKNADGTALAETAWEIGACGDKETAADMKAYLDDEFAPAYNLDYFCTPLIVGLEAGYDINANVASFRATVRPDGFTYADCLIYIDGEYDIYYYNINTKTYVKDGFKIYHGLTSTHGFSVDTLESKSTIASKTAYIIECRKKRHRTEVGNYWLLNDSLFHACFLDLVGATDNEKKNTYPYKFGTLASGSRWRWRQDDLDTIFDVNNQGFADKKYSILNTDKQGSTMIFKGNTSYHWRCIREYYKDELKGMMQRILQKMVDMCPVTYGTSIREKLIGSIRYFFWDYAQEYFTQGAYNIDAKWTYEDTWALYKKDTSINAVHPLQQLLGSHYEAEKAWVAMRVLFIASMYEFGTFVDYVDKSEGQIAFRQGGDFTFDLTPAIDMRPSVIQGQNATIIHASGRINAGDSTTIQTEADTSADTMVYIQGADWLSDIGDFSGVQIGSSSSAFAVTSKRLKSLKVGDATASNVTTNIGALDFGLCPSMIKVEARNVSNLDGNVNLTTLPRLRYAYFSGTKATSIELPEGSKVKELDLPESLQQLKLVKLPLLTESGLTYPDGLDNLTYLWVENNALLDGYDALKTAYETSSALKNIRVLGIDKRGDNTDVDFLKALADGDYYGIDASGNVDNTIKPYLQGKLYVTGSVDGDTFDYLKEAFPSMTFDADKIVAFIKFDDPEVLSILRANGVDTNSDGGITKEEAAAVTSIGTWFKGNTAITSFEEFKYFTGITTISAYPNGAFAGCTNLNKITLPTSLTNIDWQSFMNTSLANINFNDSLTSIGYKAFYSSGLDNYDVVLNNVTSVNTGAFHLSGIRSIILPKVATISSAYESGDYGSSMARCYSLVYALIGNVCTDIKWRCFAYNKSMLALICLATTPPSCDQPLYESPNAYIYVPSDSVEAYKGASGWVTYESRIRSISQLETDNPTLYAEIKDYL